MANSVAQIATLLLGGVGLSITVGAVIFASLPFWLGALTFIGILIGTIAGASQ